MYFVTKTTRIGDKTVIVGNALTKGAAWGKMREAVITELLAHDALDPFVDIHKRLPQDGGEFCDGAAGNPLELFGPILRTLAENHEKYGLTGKQKSQVMGLLSKFVKEDV